MATSNRSTLLIGDLRVDPALDEIHKDGRIIKLEPRAMRLLLCLAERAGEVVSVEELLDLVWKDVVVSPDSVYAAVASLRRNMGDDPKNPIYIANVVRRGYRLVAPVSRSPDPAKAMPVAVPPNATPPAAADSVALEAPADAAPNAHRSPTAERAQAPRSRAHFWPALAAVAAIAVGMGYFLVHRSREPKATGVSAANDKSVAVMPFLDLSEKKDQQYFADGMSEELIDQLAKMPELRVPARTSSFYFRGKEATVAEIAKALGVSHILEGSVRTSGGMLRVTAQLVRADTGYDVWSETFDRPMSDIFKVQDDIAGAVVRSLKVSLLQHNAPKPPPTSSPAAYTLYLKARMLAKGAAAEDYRSAAKYLQEALVLDPKFASAWAYLGTMQLADRGWHNDGAAGDGGCGKAREAIEEALRLDPLLSDAHRALSNLKNECESDRSGTEAELKRAIELDPGNADALRGYSYLETTHNRPRRGLELAQQAVAIDPLVAWNHVYLAFALGGLGDFAGAEASYRKALEIAPSTEGLHALLTNALLAEGKSEEALEEIQREGDPEFRQSNLPLVYDAVGRHREAEQALDEYETKYPGDPLLAADFYACRHDVEKAISWLERMPKGSNFWDVPNRANCLKNLDRDPRYQVMVKAENLPPADH